MRILGFEKLSLVDFRDKIGCTIFLHGCNFRCVFCHNKELVLGNASDYQEVNFNDILDYLKLRKGKIDAVCITGGEPTINDDLKEKLIEIKKLGYYIKLDTNGTNFNMVKDLLENSIIDYVAMDIKNSYSMYYKTIGKEYDLNDVFKTINYLINNNYDYEFRTTLVSELHNQESILEIKDMLKGAKRLYLQKFITNDNCIDKDLHCVSLEKAKEYKDILEKSIKEVYLRNY